MSRPVVAAVVPTRNRREKTLRFLQRMAAQSYPVRVVVVDANSSDGTPAAVAEQYPQVTVLAASDDDFWAAATNIGVAHALAAGADYVLTINDDSVIEPDHVARLVALAQKYDCPILGSQINYLQTCDRIWSLGTYTHWGTPHFLRLAHCDESGSDLPSEVAAAPVLPVDALPGNGVLIHRRVFETVGLYNARWLPHYHADSELIMRARRRGMAAYVTPQVVLYNDFSAEQKQLSLHSLAGLRYALCHKKSHLYLPPLLYIFSRYCPPRHWWGTLRALAARFGRLRG